MRAIAHRRPPEPEDEAVGRSADERSGRRVVGHLHLIDGEQQVAGLQLATGKRDASHGLEDDRRACVAAAGEVDADRRAARRLGQLDDRDVGVSDTIGLLVRVVIGHALLKQGRREGRSVAGTRAYRGPGSLSGGGPAGRPGWAKRAGFGGLAGLGLGLCTGSTWGVVRGLVRGPSCAQEEREGA